MPKTEGGSRRDEVTLHYESSGLCTVWGPNTTVVVTHSTGKHIGLWDRSTCHPTFNVCESDYDNQIVIDNHCNGNCKTKLVPGTSIVPQ